MFIKESVQLVPSRIHISHSSAMWQHILQWRKPSVEMYFSQAHFERSETVAVWYIFVEIFLFTGYLLLEAIGLRIGEYRYAVGQ